jgi:hypothetical protein
MQAAIAQRPIKATTEWAESADLSDLARQQLNKHPHFRGRSAEVFIEQRGNALRLSGRLPSFYLKQLVQEMLRHVPGVESVRNEIRVVRSDGISSE